MNVLIVHRYFWPEEISTLPIMLKEVVNLHRARGDKVTVVTGASMSNCEKWDEDLKSAVNIRFFSSEIDRKLTNLGRVKNMIRLFFLAIRVMRKNEFDLLYTVSYPPGLSATLVAVVRLLRKKTKVIFYVQDILTYRLSSKLQRGIYKKMFSYSCRGAHKVITLTGDMENEILRICDSFKCEVKDKVVKIPNYSPDLYTTDEDFISNGMSGDSDYPIDIVYAGNHGEAQNLGHFIKVLASDDSFSSLKVVFFGEGIKAVAGLPSLITERKINGARYTKILASYSKNHIPVNYHADHGFLTYPLLVTSRADFIEAAKMLNISLGDWFYSPVHPVTENMDVWGINEDELPNSLYCCNCVVNLPTSMINPAMVEKLIVDQLDNIKSVDAVSCNA